jgi:hypothetical protein
MFLLLNGTIALGFIIYYGAWLFSNTVSGDLISPFDPTTITVVYKVDGNEYRGNYMRNNIGFSERKVIIRYLTWNPSSSRVNSFLGMAAEPFGWWLVFLLGSGVLLLPDNVVFSKGTVFRIYKKFPWISMEEYFPADRLFEENEQNFQVRPKQRNFKQLE